MSFPIKVLSFTMNVAEVNHPPVSARKRGGRSQQSSLAFQGESHNTEGKVLVSEIKDHFRLLGFLDEGLMKISHI